MTVPMWVATVAWLLLVSGVLLRKHRKPHIACMMLGICTDVSLVLYLQVTKEAVQTAFTASLSTLQYLHISASTSALLLYFPVVALGWRIHLQGTSSNKRRWHLRLGIAAFVLRSIGWTLMFTMASLRA